ncbi:MAG TPA: ORF6C domain-containing protein [Atopostipes sp.]|nr:ORF6C domain-containing protein [Atopostipes sp.]
MAINQMEAIKFNLKRQNEQANALIQVIERIEEIESNMNEKYVEVKDMVDEIRDRVYIEHEDQKELQSIVSKKSYAIAKEYFNNDDDYGAEIRELAGYAMRHHWKLLKKHFNVTRYTSIRHVDREKAKEFVRNIRLDNVFLSGYEEWRLQRAKKREREMNLEKDHQ